MSTIVIVMVVYIHAFNPEADKLPIAGSAQRIITGLCLLANSFFFCLSGYLFFNEITDITKLFRKLKKRVRTLLIPYILWNIVIFSIFAVLWFLKIQTSADIGTIVDCFSNGNIYDAIHAVFIKPIGFQLWFLRDLIYYMALTPILYYIIKHSGWLLPILLLALDPVIHQGNLFFFVLGGCVSMKSSLNKLQASTPGILWICCMLIYVIVTVLKVEDIWWNRLFIVPLQLCGIVGIWFLYDVIAKNRDLMSFSLIATICGYSFFIFCAHEPALNVIKHVCLSITDRTEFGFLLSFILSPLIMVVICIVCAKFFETYIPGIYRLLVGGR